MKKERMSLIQKHILTALDVMIKKENKSKYRKKHKLKSVNSIHHSLLIEPIYKMYTGDDVRYFIGPKSADLRFRRFNASFSRSLRNLYKKGYVKLYRRKVFVSGDLDTGFVDRCDRRNAVGHIELTPKGETWLNVNKNVNNKGGD